MSKYAGKIVTNQAPAGYSVFFDGTGDFLTAGSNTAYNIDSGSTDSFICEGWFYWNVVQANTSLIDNGGLTGVSFPNWYIILNASSQIEIGWGNSAAPGGTIGSLSTSVVPTVGTWFHIALVKTNADWAGFVNGVRRTNFNGLNTAAKSSASPLRIADGITSQNSGVRLNGYVSNVRIYKGATANAPYSATSTTINVPTQLLNITNTSLLTCNSPAIVDQSSNAFAITVNGNSAVSTFTPFTAYVPYNPALGASTPGVWTLDEAMQAAATRQWNMYDPNFQNTTLLLHGNVPSGTSTWLTDASTNNFAVTSFGAARSDTLSPFSSTTYPTTGSGYFATASDYAQSPTNSTLALGTGDFCVECWVYVSGGGNFRGFFQPTTDNLNVQRNSSGNIEAWDGTTRSTSTPFSSNVWNHVAFTRSSGTARLFLNGTQVTTWTSTVNYSTDMGFIVGYTGNGSFSVSGYISNFRVVKGSAVYTSNFTPSTAPLTAITNTVLLTLQNGPIANNTFLDSSSNNFTITRNGNTTQGSFSPFSNQVGAWSTYFDGSGDSFSVSTSTVLDLNGAIDFTIEAWVYLTGYGSTSDMSLNIANKFTGAGGLGYTYGIYGGGANQGKIQFYGAAGSVSIISTNVIPLNSWNHVAIVKSGTTYTHYLNGVANGSQTTATTLTASANALVIGDYGYSDDFLGYMSNLRITKNGAVYTSGFTPPTSPLTTSVSAGTVSLLTFQSNRFVDNSSNGFTLTPSGTPSVQAFSPFYPTAAYTPATIGGSGYFDGNGDNLVTPSNTAFDPSGQNITVDFWVYLTRYANANNVVFEVGNSSVGDLQCIISNTGSVSFQTGGNAGSTRSGFTLNSWNYITCVKSGTNLTVYLNAVAGTTVSLSPNSKTTMYIGSQSSGNNLDGYISNFRYIRGSANVPSSVPTAPLTAITNTSLLLNFTNAGIVDSTAKNVLETVGNAQISTAQSRFGGGSMYFDGTGDALYIPTPQKENLRFGTGDFTIEFWAWKSANGSSGFDAVISVGSTGNYNGGFAVELSASRGFCFIYDAAVRISSNFNPNDSTWHHYAVVRSGSTFALYRDGVQLTTAALTPTLGVTGEAWIGSGVNSTGNNYNGYLDELRVTKGIARYTGNFTPQTSQWQDQ